MASSIRIWFFKLNFFIVLEFCFMMKISAGENFSNGNSNTNFSVLCPDQDVLKIPFVSVLDSESFVRGEDRIFSIINIGCIGHHPIKWNFHTFPVEEKWNVTCERRAKNIRDDSTFSFESNLLFLNVSVKALSEYQPTCEEISNPACHRCTVLINHESASSTVNSTFLFDSSPRIISEVGEDCRNRLSLTFDSSSQLFYCSSNNSSSSEKGSKTRPEIRFQKCSNPTECGKPKAQGLCLESNPSSAIKCRNGSSDCAIAYLKSDLETPMMVTCKQNSSSTGAYLQLFRSTVDNSKSQFPKLYFDWENVDTEQLLYLEASKIHIISLESFDIICTMSYFVFAKGAHITLKDLSDPVHLEQDLLTQRNVTLLETIEVQTQEEQNTTGSDDFVLPVKRTLVAQGLNLTKAGDYELTCYAPVWNAFKWVSKSLLISVTESQLPEFVNGNSTVNLKFHSMLNISCIAKAKPAPQLHWIFENELFGMSTIELGGSDEMIHWSFLTLPKITALQRHVIKCRAENLVGFVEKVFVIERDDESSVLHTKIASSLLILGFIVNLIVLFFCWKHLFAGGDSSLLKFFKLSRQSGGKGKEDVCKKCDDIGRVENGNVLPPTPCSSIKKNELPAASSSSLAKPTVP